MCVVGGRFFGVFSFVGGFLLLVGWGFFDLVFCNHCNIMEPDL